VTPVENFESSWTNKTDQMVIPVKELAFENRGMIIRKGSEILGTSFRSVQSILKGNLYLCWIAAKFLTHPPRENVKLLLKSK
jgi:hypothetical protein